MNSKQRRRERRHSIQDNQLVAANSVPEPKRARREPAKISITNRMGGIASQAFKGVGLLLTALATIVTLAGAWYSFKPNLFVQQVDLLNPDDPSSVQFAVKNAGWTSIGDLKFSCDLSSQGKYHMDGVHFEGNGLGLYPHHPNQAPVLLLKPGQSTTKYCGLSRIALAQATIDFSVTGTTSGTSWIYGGSQKFKFRFTSEADDLGHIHWVQQSSDD
jgi:hypothetical protein